MGRRTDTVELAESFRISPIPTLINATWLEAASNDPQTASGGRDATAPVSSFPLPHYKSVTVIKPTQVAVLKSSWKINQGHVKRGLRQTVHPRDPVRQRVALPEPRGPWLGLHSMA